MNTTEILTMKKARGIIYWTLKIIPLVLVISFTSLKAESHIEILEKLKECKSERDCIEYILNSINDFDFDFTLESGRILDTLSNLIEKNDLTEYLPELYLSYGVYWLIQADYLKSTKYLTDALKLAEQLGDQHLIGRIVRQLGENYRATRDFDLSIIHLKRAEKIFKELNDSLYLARTYNRFAAVMHQDKDQYPVTAAIKYAEMSNKIANALNDTSLLVNNYNIIGASYRDLKDYGKAIEYLERSVSMADVINSVEYSNYLNNIAGIYYYQGDFKKAIINGLKAYELASKRGLTYSLVDIANLLAISYDTLGDYKKAYYYRTKQTNYFDAIFNASKRQAILEFEIKYQNEKNMQKIKTQEMQQKYQYAVFFVIGFSLLSIIYIYYRKQKQLSKANSELSDLNRQISEQNQQLNNLNITKDKFFSIIAHDLKNPIAALRNLSELMVDEYNNLDDNELYDFTKEIKDTSSTLFELLENLLIWSNSQSGKIDFKPVRMDLCYIIKSNIDLMRLAARRKDIELSSKGDCPCYINIDHNMITTVIRNLVSNAIKFTNNGGKITVSHTEYEDNVIISIKDNGIGMSEKIRERLFRIDVTVTTLGTNNERGTGLGLIICKEFIDMHEGTIEVISTQGEGSDFIITLPKKEV